MTSVQHQSFWAKSADLDSGAYKSVAHHNLDVAACALRLLERSPARLSREMRLTGLTASSHAQLCSLLAGLHDLGKISRNFQFQLPRLWPVSVLGEPPSTLPRTFRHWQATALLLNAAPVKSALSPVFGPDGLHVQILAAVAGHHGTPPSTEHSAANEWAAARSIEIGPKCVEVATQLCSELIDLFPDLRDVQQIADPEGFSFALNGLITLADWIGSDEESFPFASPGTPLSIYWQLALEKAHTTVEAKGLVPARSSPHISLSAIFGQSGAPRPMQRTVMDTHIRQEPQIVVIEDGTGSGKTEAALLLAQRMVHAGLGEGLFVALPTMATANAMHSRLEKAMPGLFVSHASLVLAHGKTILATSLQHLSSRTANYSEASATAGWFNAWIADSRKKAFFAHVGAGTIDQAFLSILPKKHLTMRQYALAGRILIVDEAHACDAYMGEELKTLVEMQARLGGSVIILSATLNKAARAGLVRSFAVGRGLHSSRFKTLTAAISSESYPLLTRWSECGGVEEFAVTGDHGLSRRVAVSRISSRDAVVAAAHEAASKGAAVAIVCNAVDSAVTIWRSLLQAGQEPARCHLFHSRFAIDDRLAIEEQVQAWFGRSSTSGTRAGRILVATQVIEQSLDVDFDVMFSDLAPVDLLIQRAGRLWRHSRSDRPVEEPVLHMLSPEPSSSVDEDWLNDVLGPAAFVYRVPGVMWRTARYLLNQGSLETPNDLRRLIENTYSTLGEDLPDNLQAGHDASAGAEYARRALGQHNSITPSGGYLALKALSADEDIGTRLGEKSLTLRIARREGQMLVPYCCREGASDRLNWALSEISVRESWFRRAHDGIIPESVDIALTEAARTQWPEWERNIPLYEVDESGQLQGTALSYSGIGGLSIHKGQ